MIGKLDGAEPLFFKKGEDFVLKVALDLNQFIDTFIDSGIVKVLSNELNGIAVKDKRFVIYLLVIGIFF